MLWIRIGFNEDPDLGSQTIADPDLDPGQTLRHKKLNFYMKNILKVGNKYKNILTIFKGTKDREPGFGQLPCSWTRIRLPNTDPDSGRTAKSMRIWLVAQH